MLYIWKRTAALPKVCHLTTSSLPLHTHTQPSNELTSVSSNLQLTYLHMLRESSPTSCLLHPPSMSPSPTYTAHESVLEDACWIPFGIESLFITPFGGVFPLVHKGGEEEGGKPVIQLHVPQGAVRTKGEGMMEVRYAVILDGPFKTPEGYRLCSPAVYIHYNPAQATKPFHLLLPHWSGAPDHPTFVASPHTLPEGEQYYPFRLLEGGEFGEGYGIVEVDGHSSLFGEAYQLKDTSRYYASLWEREEGAKRYSKVAVTFRSNVWIRVSVCCDMLHVLSLFHQSHSDTDSEQALDWVEEATCCVF